MGTDVIQRIEEAITTAAESVKTQSASPAPTPTIKAQIVGSGGGAGGDLVPLLTVTISSPVNGASVVGPNAGVPITITGRAYADLTSGTNLRVNVRLGAGNTFQPVTSLVATDMNGNYTWTWQGTTPVGGSFAIVAQALLDYVDANEANQTETKNSTTVTVYVDTTSPTVAITAPANNSRDPLAPGVQGVVQVAGTASDVGGSGVRIVEWSTNGTNFNSATPRAPGDWSSWSANVNSNLGTATITVRATDWGGNTATQAVAHDFYDNTPPVLVVNNPVDDFFITGTSSGATVSASGTASDIQTGVVSVTWSLDTGQSGQATTQNNWAAWTISIPVPLGIHTITFRCTDGNHDGPANVATITRKVTVGLPYTPPDPNDAVSPLAYLLALLQFTTAPITGTTARVTISNQNIAIADLNREFHQRLDELSNAANKQTANAPVHQVRIAVEVLRAYLQTLSPVPDLTSAGKAYCQAAYTSLLTQLGTSYEEIRLARSYPAAQRQALAARLGIDLGTTQPDPLTVLLLDPAASASQSNAMTEQNLERLFGLVDTTRDPFAPSTTPLLQTWQLAHLRTLWAAQDFPANMPANAPPLIDPDLLVQSDFANPVATDPAYSRYLSRQTTVQSWLTTLTQQPKTPAGLNTMLQNVLHKSSADIVSLDQQRQNGSDITGTLAALNLSLDAFNYLARMCNLAVNNSPLLASEWNDIYAILVQVQKIGTFASWQNDERSAKLTLSPDYFVIPAIDPTVFPPPAPVQLPAWRATNQARRAWQDTLQARIAQQQAVVENLGAAVSATEEVALPLLRDAIRDAIVASMASANPGLDVPNWLSERLLIDVKGSGYSMTTRLGQAIETLQGVFFSLRTHRFGEMVPQPSLASWTLTEDPPSFDKEWEWMGSYASWQAAMSVFLYPENLLFPSLREDSTQAFQNFVNTVRGYQPLTPQLARDAAAAYLSELRGTLPDSTQPAYPDLPVELQAQPPAPNSPIVITEQMDGVALLAWAARSQSLYTAYQGQLSKLNYIREVFYFVPMHLALQLKQAGQYNAALDWFRTVYAYSLPVPQRKIWYGLVAEHSIQPQYQQTPQWLLTSLNPHEIAKTRPDAYTRFTLMSLARCFLEFADAEFTADSVESISRARGLYLTALDLFSLPEMQTPTNSPVATDPVLSALQLHGVVNLLKLRASRNIAGMQRQVQGYDGQAPSGSQPAIGASGQLIVNNAAALQPTPYRYSALIERAKQLVTLSQQVESAFLSALQQKDTESYNILKARQDLNLALANVTLQNLRVTEASDGVDLAALQKQRAEVQATTYTQWIQAGPNQYEDQMIQNYRAAGTARDAAAQWESYAAISQAASSIFTSVFQIAENPLAAAGAMVSAFGTIVTSQGRTASTIQANDAETAAQVASAQASFERRLDEWTLQQSLAEQDSLIGSQQITIASDHQSVVTQERTIASTQQDHAQATVNFLSTKFTNVELYDWMSDILERVYRYFLQQATAMAKLAENQLTFERQEQAPSIIQADYWQAPSDNSTSTNGNNQTPDRRGLTGSARLLQDIYQLDQYAFETNKRKLQLSKTISLARLAPFEFQQFRQTGVLPFATPMKLFDQDFPGHYLRLIKRVRTSVVALIPPTLGIRATLSTSGVSRVTIGDPVFQTVAVRRDPESIALSSPLNATGLFDLDTQADMLLPFEGMGVDTTWEFQMPKAANPFDYDTIADVLITIEYTALNSYDYREQVIQQLDRSVSADRVFSFRQQFADAWYDLHNPSQSATPMTVQFATESKDFPPNVDGLQMAQLLLYFARVDGATFEVPVSHLQFTPQGSTTPLGAGATSVQGVISTRRESGQSWVNASMLGRQPFGQWELAFPYNPTTDLTNAQSPLNLFKNSQIEDILLIITYSGQTPPWPA